jgi:AcrR family transcriptional regulator
MTVLSAEAQSVNNISFTSKQIDILEAYLELGLKQGVAGITLQKMAQHLKLSLGTIHYHFGGKKNHGLLDSALIYVSQESFKYVSFSIEQQEQDKNFNGVATYIRTLFEWAQLKQHHALFWIYYFYLCTYDERSRRFNQAYLDMVHQRLRSMIIHGQKKGIYPKFTVRQSLIDQLFSQIMGCLLLSTHEPSKESFARQEKVATSACDILIGSMS